MKRRTVLHASALLGSIALLLASATPSEAFLFPCLFHGGHHAGYSAHYGYRGYPGNCAPRCYQPPYRQPCGYYPRPRRYYYPPVCNPCAPVCGSSPCGIASACGTNIRAQSPDQLEPIPSDGSEPPPTFEGDLPDERMPPMPPEDSGFRPRESGNGSSFSDEPGGGRESFRKPIEVPEASSPEIEPAPFDEPTLEDPIPGEDGSEEPLFKDDTQSAIPLQDLDQKITWRSSPVRTRQRIHARFNDPLVARTKVDPKSRWRPVLTERKIASK